MGAQFFCAGLGFWISGGYWGELTNCVAQLDRAAMLPAEISEVMTLGMGLWVGRAEFRGCRGQGTKCLASSAV